MRTGCLGIIVLNTSAAREVWLIAQSESVAARALAGEDVEDMEDADDD